jgi:ferredoxin
MAYKINKEKCIGCGLCVSECPGGTELEKDGKARIVDQKKLESCGGEKLCPYQAIEKKN